MTRTVARTRRIHPPTRLLAGGVADYSVRARPGKRGGASLTRPPRAADRIRRLSPPRRLGLAARGLDLVLTIARRLNLVRPITGCLHVLAPGRLDIVARRPISARGAGHQRGRQEDCERGCELHVVVLLLSACPSLRRSEDPMISAPGDVLRAVDVPNSNALKSLRRRATSRPAGFQAETSAFMLKPRAQRSHLQRGGVPHW